MSSPPPPVLYEETEGTARITLNRPRRGNALSPSLLRGVLEAVDAAEASPSVRAVVLGASGRFFCTGMDLSAEAQREVRGDTAAFTALFLKACERLRSLSKPLVASVQGPALGGGIVLIFLADVRLMAPAAYVQFSEARRGLVPAMISTFIVPQLGAFRSRELFMTGRRVPADELLRMGALTAVGAVDALVPEYCAHLLASAPRASAACKRLVAFVDSHAHEDNVREARRVFAECVRGDEARYGTECFRARATPDWSKL